MLLPRIDQNSEQGVELQGVVQRKLKDFLGAEYADDVLPLYIVVMLAHGNNHYLVAENLEAFLGANDSVEFVKWLFSHLEEHGHKYAAPEPEPEAEAEAEDKGVGEAPEEVHAEPTAALAGSAEDIKQGSSKERRQDAIQWRGDSSSRHHRSERPRDEKRGRDEPSRTHRTSSHHHEREADVGRDAKRRRRDMRELHSLDAGRDERPRERDWSCNDERYSREERDHDRHEWERQQRRSQMERDNRDHREMRDRDRGRDRPHYMDRDMRRDRERDRDLHMRPRQRAYIDFFEDEPAVIPGPPRRRHDVDLVHPHEEEKRNRLNGHDDLEAPETQRVPPTLKSQVKSQAETVRREEEPAAHSEIATRGNVFDRLGRNKTKPYLSPAAARKSVFDRLRGNIQAPAREEEVKPGAVTDDEPWEEEPAMGKAANSEAIASKVLNGIKANGSQGKADDLSEMKRKMLQLQEQVRQLERQQRGSPAAGAPLLATSAAASTPALPAVDPRTVHVQGVSPLAVPEVIAAHFSGCGRVTNVTIARDMQGLPRGFAHVEFSYEVEAQNALSLSGSMLLQQMIVVTPRINRPQLPFIPHFGGRGRSGRSPPFISRGGGPSRGRGRMPQPLVNRKYIRPELLAQKQTDSSQAATVADVQAA